MALIKEGRIVADPWRALADDEDAPGAGPVLLSWRRWRAERDGWRGRGAPLGVRVPPEVPAREIAADMANFALVALEFPKLVEGRPYSTARLLRGRHGYTGEIRAVGEIIRDQLAFLARCGFDAFAIKPGHDAVGALAAFGEIQVALQPAGDGIPEALRRRRSRLGGAAFRAAS